MSLCFKIKTEERTWSNYCWWSLVRFYCVRFYCVSFKLFIRQSLVILRLLWYNHCQDTVGHQKVGTASKVISWLIFKVSWVVHASMIEVQSLQSGWHCCWIVSFRYMKVITCDHYMNHFMVSSRIHRIKSTMNINTSQVHLFDSSRKSHQINATHQSSWD